MSIEVCPGTRYLPTKGELGVNTKPEFPLKSNKSLSPLRSAYSD